MTLDTKTTDELLRFLEACSKLDKTTPVPSHAAVITGAEYLLKKLKAQPNA